LLEAIYRQDYPKDCLEVLIADGLSTDRTLLEIAAFQEDHPDLKIKTVENRLRIIPAGLNRAIEEANGEIFVRLDAHSMPYPDYISRCVTGLVKGAGHNVGGVWEILPGRQTAAGRAIAAAAAHPLGVGDAFYRFTGTARSVDTVPFGAFHRKLVERIGGYDESLLTNEDYEFNTRVRKSGGVVWLDPAIRSSYFARPTYTALARQYWRYGYWKARMLKRYPNTLRWRQLLPPLFVISLVGLAILSVLLPLARWTLLGEGIIYGLILFAASLRLAQKKSDISLLTGVPAAIAVMHLFWGSGFLWSAIRQIFKQDQLPKIPYMVNG
jgi:glycosyltransferase involved in cell wall biosynthesis